MQSMIERDIRQLLVEIRLLLERHEVRLWARNFADLEKDFGNAITSRDQVMIRQSLQKIQEIYGGMGSFNDVFISPQAGHRIDHANVTNVNRKLQELGTKLHTTVQEELLRFLL